MGDRALETAREDPVFEDHLAEHFAGAPALKRAARHNTEGYSSIQPGKVQARWILCRFWCDETAKHISVPLTYYTLMCTAVGKPALL